MYSGVRTFLSEQFRNILERPWFSWGRPVLLGKQGRLVLNLACAI